MERPPNDIEAAKLLNSATGGMSRHFEPGRSTASKTARLWKADLGHRSEESFWWVIHFSTFCIVVYMIGCTEAERLEDPFVQRIA